MSAARPPTTGGGLTTKSLIVPVLFVIDCSGAELALRGMAQIGFKDIDGRQCMSSLKVKFSGNGEVAGLVDVLIDEGSSISSTGSAFILPTP